MDCSSNPGTVFPSDLVTNIQIKSLYMGPTGPQY
jgi:hypothetical protein